MSNVNGINGEMAHLPAPDEHKLADVSRLYLLNYDLERAYTSMERGAKCQKVFLHRRGESSLRICAIKRETRQLTLFKISGDAKNANFNGHDINFMNNTNFSAVSPIGLGSADHLNVKSFLKSPTCIDCRLIKEVKTLEQKLATTKFGDKLKCLQTLYEPTRVLTILHGQHFVLNWLILAFDSSDLCSTWCEGLNSLVEDSLTASYPLIIERWLRKEFYAIVNPQTNCVPVKDFKPFIQQRLQYKITSKALQALTEEQMGFEAFANAYRRLIHVNSLFTDRFSNYSTDGRHVPFNSIAEFFINEQRDSLLYNVDKCAHFLRQYIRDVDVSRDISHPYLTVHEFIDFLFSRENSVWDPRNDSVIQDMEQPLCNYWIASSHNTYLTGDQLKSESSLEAYARALLMGCRCIELDVWDGQKKSNSDPEIVIYHGYTMTSKLNLKDVLQTIKEYSFITSDYPVILSIEDNCTLNFQRQLAQDLKDILGEYLLMAPLDKEEKQLPSPNQLKRKIVVKHKKLPTEAERNQSIVSLNSLDDSFQDQDILSKPGIIKKGVLQLKDSVSGDWNPHIFLLFADRLCYTSDMNLLYAAAAGNPDNPQFMAADFQAHLAATNATNNPDDEAQDQQESENAGATASNNASDELHLTEEWFHGKISRDEAVDLLKSHMNELGDGLFLVRESTTFVGDYSLSFLHIDEVHHCRIKTTLSNGCKQYHLLDSKKMDTLYELISYYQEHQLATPRFRAKLVTPCPQPSPHIGQPWFAGDIDRQLAEKMLNDHPLDGSFLIRYSGSGDDVFTLSFRVDGLIKHGRLKKEGRMFVIGSHQFENLNLMVEYYEKHEFYHGVCLKYPVNQETIANYSKDTSHAPAGCYLDLKTIDNNKPTFVRARTSYIASDEKTQLSFPAGAIIAVTVKEDGFWWKGIYKDKQGLVPVDHVEIVPQSVVDGLTGDGLGSVWIDLSKATLELLELPEKEYTFKLYRMGSHLDTKECIIAANSKEDLSDWLNSIQETIKIANDKAMQLRSREKCMKIASELSNLVIYCQAVQFNPERIPGYYFEMISFNDSKLERFIEKGLVRFNLNQLSRVYPNASRLTSNNFNPILMWAAGVQMVALNYQTADKPMQLNQGKFLANGKCGYVIKPGFMRQANYDLEKACLSQSKTAITLTIEMIAGRHLCRKDKGKGIVSPVVEVEILGLPCDSRSQKTRPKSCDGLHPVWEERFVFEISYPDSALIRFYVEEGDFVKTDPFIGQAVYPVDCLRPGYRSVILKNAYSEELELSSLLVHLDIRKQDPNAKSIFGQQDQVYGRQSQHQSRPPSLSSSCANSTFDEDPSCAPGRWSAGAGSIPSLAGPVGAVVKNGKNILEKSRSIPGYAFENGGETSGSSPNSKGSTDSVEPRKKSSILRMFKRSK